jgi:hypothetical protein
LRRRGIFTDRIFTDRIFTDNDAITTNDLPNPYRTQRGWAELPKGMTWPAITGLMDGPDGNLLLKSEAARGTKFSS